MAKITDAVDPGNAGGSVLIPEIPTLPNRPVTFQCDKCGEVFTDREARRQHVFDHHPFKRPQLLVGSRMVKERGEVMASQFLPADWVIQQAERIVINQQDVSSQEASRQLSKIISGFHEVTLTSADYSVTYQIEFDIPTETQLLAVEKTFNMLIVNQPLESERIAQFITVAKREDGGRYYIEGISDFLYGVLAKDQRGGTSLNRDDYTAKFHAAREALRFMDRPLANLIKALVNFNDNAFSEAEILAPGGQVAIACRMLNGLRSGKHCPPAETRTASGHNLPVDTLTAEIMRFCSLPLAEQREQLPQLAHLASKRLTTDHDRVKIQALAMNTCWEAGDHEQAVSWARMLRHSPLFETLANRIIEDVEND
ncbi:MAG: C2H2-type zinc finger protein [Pseudomonadota bacterium]|nr:C2H2-type zinc finger protein [Pseudomonadota bacterium]